MSIGIGDIELLGAVLEAVVEAGSRCACGNLILVHLGQVASVHFVESGREENALPLFNVHLEVSWHVEVFLVWDAAFLVLLILDSLVPVRVEDETRLVAQLHEQGGVALVHTCGDAIAHLGVVAAGHRIFHT